VKKIVFGILALCLVTGCGEKELNNNETDNQNVTNEITVYDNKEFFDFGKLSQDSYAFVVVSNDQNGDDLKVLNKNSGSEVIARCINDCGIWGIQVKNKKLYFYINHFLNRTHGTTGTAQGNYTKLISVDLNTLNAKVEMESNDFDITFYYDINDKYVFTNASKYNGVLRYDMDTKEVATISNIDSGKLFIYDNKVYDVTNLTQYYTMDFDGNNINYISEYEYENAKMNANIKTYLHETPYLIVNGKKLIVQKDKLLLDNEVILTAASPNYGDDGYISDEEYYTTELRIEGTENYGEVIVSEWEVYYQSEGAVAYYKLNVNTKEFEKLETNEKGYLKNDDNYEMPKYFIDIK